MDEKAATLLENGWAMSSNSFGDTFRSKVCDPFVNFRSLCEKHPKILNAGFRALSP